jgi:drug/metabolite transporter (DMT)-like permease
MSTFRHVTAGCSARLVPSLIGAVGVMLWAAETTLITFTTAIPPVQTVGLAFVFAALLSPVVWWVTGSGPRAAFRLPASVWIVAVGALVGYHACIYYATQKAPPAAAALLQGTTPLMIVLGSALLPGERLRWWHVAGATFGLVGVLALIDGGESSGSSPNAAFYLSLIGIAAALWGLYAIFSRSQPDVPSSALGVFYAASAAICLAAHGALETWVTPTGSEWAAIAGLGILPMGLAIYFWDFGIKRGDIQALGAFAYVEPFIGAVLVALFAQGYLDLSLLLPGVLVVGGAVLASASLWNAEEPAAVALGTSLE